MAEARLAFLPGRGEQIDPHIGDDQPVGEQLCKVSHDVLPGAGVLRFPVKAWLLVAVGLALLVSLGWERALAPREIDEEPSDGGGGSDQTL